MSTAESSGVQVQADSGFAEFHFVGLWCLTLSFLERKKNITQQKEEDKVFSVGQSIKLQVRVELCQPGVILH